MVNFFMNKFRYLISIIFIESLFLFSLYGQTPEYKKYSNPDIENSAMYVAGNIYQKDFLLFIDMLQTCHPAFAAESAYAFNIDSIKQAGYKFTEKCKSTKELWSYMQAIATLLNDGHTSLMPEMNMNFMYPVAFFIDENDMYIRAINEDYKSSLGKKIDRINGYKVNDVINQFKRLISSDNEIYFKDKINNFITLYSIWEYTPLCLPDSSLQLTFTDASKVAIRPISSTQAKIVQIPQAQNIAHEATRKKNGVPFHYMILPEMNLCYLHFNTCTDQSTMRWQFLQTNSNITESALKEFEESTSQYPRFDVFLKEMFELIRKDKIGTLVIDVTSNGGGNSNLCDILLSWLKPVKETKTMNAYTRFSELWKQSYPVPAAIYEKAFAEKQQLFAMEKLYDEKILASYLPKNAAESKFDKLFIRNNDENLIFKGNIIFVQSARTFSSAGLLITTAIDNNIGITIGEKSSYKPCHNGDLLAWELPNTKIKGKVSHKIFYRPNANKCNENYLSPDVYLSPIWTDVLEGKNIYWEWILKNYVNKN